MKHKMIKIAVIFSIVLGAGYALAFQGMCPKNRGEGCERVCCKTDMIPGLTEEQKTAINTLKETFTNDASPIREEIRSKHMELKTLMQGETIDKDAIDAKHEEIAALKEKLEKVSLAFQVGMAELLTPEQRKLLGPGVCPMAGAGDCPMGQGASHGCPGKKGMGYPKGEQGKGLDGKSNCPMLQNKS